ncbi:protein-L-isoaspartate(D-aspartate) O-methyltransferase [Brevibacterium sanguinis]|uniref:Protein-L-isoaspartate O-methyltransferase n=2 Tax=Brevibacterium TaxID=1696 RepID=A0A366INF0_9MICO|nr:MULTISPECIES: methyltransferase domain-containing protein [Brevibacterium]RBP67985.1 protein-L-isoaspartate(D-aspartate) O-methyltransferase [Brevibacterium sanguinis]RBP74598.1 protein-L-isoaspartate(D-aspartate) O-methyltransferase [Brevibacterium celere]
MESARRRTSLADAFSRVPRERFLPEDQRELADVNVPLPIGQGQTNSQPSTVVDMLELLDAQPGNRVLDLGSGSGWTTALLAVLVGAEGQVIGVERQHDLVAISREVLAGFDFANLRIVEATPGTFGLPAEAPFDRILVSAETDSLPTTLIEQLDRRGVMVIPVAGTMLRVERIGPGAEDVSVTRHGRYSFVPLIED